MDAPLDTRQLRAFHVLAREGSFTRAGEVLHLTQSAVSHAIKSLEADLGCQLFYRQGRRVFLTHHGRELLSHAEAIHSQMEQARTALGSLDQTPRGRLRIGTTTAAAQFILPAVLREFKESFAGYSVAVVPGETPDAIRRLHANELDLSVCLKPHDVTALECHPIFSDELELLVGAHHPWVERRPKWRDVAAETLIISSRQSYTFQLIAEYFLKQGIRLTSPVELGSNEAIKELVKLGLGVGMCARWTARAEVKSGQLCVLPLPKGHLKRDWVVARLKKRPLNLAERTFLGLCEEVGARLAESGN